EGRTDPEQGHARRRGGEGQDGGLAILDLDHHGAQRSGQGRDQGQAGNGGKRAGRHGDEQTRQRRREQGDDQIEQAIEHPHGPASGGVGVGVRPGADGGGDGGQIDAVRSEGGQKRAGQPAPEDQLSGGRGVAGGPQHHQTGQVLRRQRHQIQRQGQTDRRLPVEGGHDRRQGAEQAGAFGQGDLAAQRQDGEGGDQNGGQGPGGRQPAHDQKDQQQARRQRQIGRKHQEQLEAEGQQHPRQHGRGHGGRNALGQPPQSGDQAGQRHHQPGDH